MFYERHTIVVLIVGEVMQREGAITAMPKKSSTAQVGLGLAMQEESSTAPPQSQTECRIRHFSTEPVLGARRQGPAQHTKQESNKRARTVVGPFTADTIERRSRGGMWPSIVLQTCMHTKCTIK